MSRSALSVRPRPSMIAVLASVSLVGVASLAGGGPILEVYDDSLTTYLPSSATPVQDIRPMAAQRGVGLDGALWSPSSLPIVLNANPLGSPVVGLQRLGDVRLDLGTYSVTEIDLSLPATVAWRVGRTYNGRQETSGSSHRHSDGYQGMDWFQSSQPELVVYEHPSDDTKDVAYIVYGADRYIELKRQDDGEESPTAIGTYKAVNGAAGLLVYEEELASGEPDTYTYYDQVGTRVVFFGFDADASPAAGQIWKIIGTGGDEAFVGDATTKSTAISSGYDAGGRIEYAYDSADRRFTYTYTTLDSVKRLTEVSAETKTGGTWASPTGVTEVGRVEYDYYHTGDNTYGANGALQIVRRVVPMSSGPDVEYKTHYRYDVGSTELVYLVMDPEGARKYDYEEAGDSLLDEDFLTAATANPWGYYVSAQLEYDGSNRVDTYVTVGGCGCSGGSAGTIEISYDTVSGSFASGYDSDLASYAQIDHPGDLWELRYFDELGQPMRRVLADEELLDDLGTPSTWITDVSRSETAGKEGVVEYVTKPGSHGSWNDTNGSFASNYSDILDTFEPSTDATRSGLPRVFKTRSDPSGGTTFTTRTTETLTRSTTVGSVSLDRPLVDSMTRATGEETDYTYTYHSSAAVLRAKKIDIENETVTTAKNGSNSATTRARYMRDDGTGAFVEREDGVFTYTKVEQGLVTERRVDAKLNGTFPSGDDPNTDFGITENGNGLDLKTTYTHDGQGRVETATLPSGRVTQTHFTSLDDGRLVTLRVPRKVGSTYYGPVSYTITNQAGKVEAQGVIEFSGGSTTTAIASWIDENDADPITAVDTGSLSRWSTTIHDQTGQRRDSSRTYHAIPASGAGADGTNYDETTYDYDTAGRMDEVTDPTGTITKTNFDVLGRPTSVETGTSGNLTTVALTEYDSGNFNANGLVTKRTVRVQGSSTDERVTTYEYDSRDRLVVTNNPQAPHVVVKYDSSNRVIARGLYSGTANISASTDPAAAGMQTDRVALTETEYDERGRVWKTTRHEVDASDGSLDDSLTSETWYDEAGRVIMREGDQLTKTIYDRLGRPTHVFTLASHNDTSYADADDVGGDTVLVESQTYYEDDTGNALMRVIISRYHDDTSTTGGLDTDSDESLVDASEVEGRIQITSMWYDDQDRLIDVVALGTYGGSDYDRDSHSSAHARSDTALRTTTTYNDDGTVKSTTDPAGTETRFEYDDLGRRTKVIANYVDGTEGGTNDDEDQIIEYEYTDGLRTKYIARMDTGTTDDQETVYTYGVTTAQTPASTLYSNRLLRSVTYPDTGVVLYAYNAQGQRVAMRDQEGNVITTEHDTGGRKTAERVTTLDADFDGSVRAIRLAYDSLGRASTITQYDDDSSTAASDVVDQLEMGYDGWGNLVTKAQDFNSEIDYAGSVDHWTVEWDWAKDTGGRQTLRRTNRYVHYNDSTEKQDVQYTYDAGIDDDTSRVSAVKVDYGSAVTIAEYAYLGQAQFVGVDYVEPSDDVLQRLYGSTSGDYPDLDRFNRVTSCVWSKDVTNGPIDFYDVDVSYDRVSNVDVVEDNVYSGWDVAYTHDGLDRLTQADRGTWNGSSITSQKAQEVWALDLAGNWSTHKLDLDGDLNYTDPNEFNYSGTFNDANEQTVRGSFTRTHDALGNLTDNGDDQEYLWDPWGRLIQVSDQSSTLIARYRYNGLGERIAVQDDTDGDASVETSNSNDDPWRYQLYDDRWRVVAMINAIDDGAGLEAGEDLADADDDAKELFVHHAAGLNGFGGSSYIDTTILRDADVNGGWASASDGTLEHRTYFCQNWRGDVVNLLDETGGRRETVRYDAYGMPFGIPRSNTSGGARVTFADSTAVNAANGKSVGDAGYNVRVDINLDGTVNSTDTSTVSADFGQIMGRGVLSRPATATAGVGNSRGYAGYTFDDAAVVHHVRHRVSSPTDGRWLRRDPIGYVDGASLYEYVASRAIEARDPMGMQDTPVACVPYSQLNHDGNLTEGSSVTLGGGCGFIAPFNFPPSGMRWLPFDIPVDPSLQQDWNSCLGDTVVQHALSAFRRSCGSDHDWAIIPQPPGLQNPARACCLSKRIRIFPSGSWPGSPAGFGFCAAIAQELLHAADLCEAVSSGRHQCIDKYNDGCGLINDCDFNARMESRGNLASCCITHPNSLNDVFHCWNNIRPIYEDIFLVEWGSCTRPQIRTAWAHVVDTFQSCSDPFPPFF